MLDKYGGIQYTKFLEDRPLLSWVEKSYTIGQVTPCRFKTLRFRVDSVDKKPGCS